MTAVVARSSASLAIPQSQNTAPVHEYRCLYSHDIRRKQKRWQDGLVKFHTFNKRVMVYDEGRNFLGDTHWKEQEELQADDEVTLDIGILVQVGEILATSQTDLAPLFERERKRPEEVDGEGNGLSTAARVALGGKANAAPRAFQKHRSLNALLGTSKGQVGRSMFPAKSPYEMRNGNNENEWEDNRNVKRRKVDQPCAATRLSKERLLRAGTSDSRKGLPQKLRIQTPLSGQRSLMVKEIVDITSDNEGVLTSDVTLPSTPAMEPVPRTVPKAKPVVKTPAPRISKPKTTQRREGPSYPPVSAKNHLKIAVDTRPTMDHMMPRGTEAIVKDTSLLDTEENIEPQRLKLASKAKPLRIAKSQPRSMLLCQKSTTAAAGSQPLWKSQKSEETAIGVEPEAETTLLQTLMPARRPQVNPFADLSDSDDDIILSKVVPKKVQPKGKERVLVQTFAPGPSKGGAAILASDGTNRPSPPGFGTMPPRPEHFEPLADSAAPVSIPPPTVKRRQRTSASSSESSDMEIMHRLVDQQFSVPSNAQASTSKAAPGFLPQPKPTAKAPFLPPSKSTARAPFVPPSKPTFKSPFRRVHSESNTNSGNDCLIVSSPIEEPEPIAAVLRPSQEEILRKVPTRSKRATRKPLQRSMSLATGTTEKANATSREKAKQVEIVQEKKREMGPWTIEATDLFEWRPPDWEERVKRREKEFGY